MSHDADTCDIGADCNKCLRFANSAMQDATRGFLDKIGRLKRALRVAEEGNTLYRGQLAYIRKRVFADAVQAIAAPLDALDVAEALRAHGAAWRFAPQRRALLDLGDAIESGLANIVTIDACAAAPAEGGPDR